MSKITVKVFKRNLRDAAEKTNVNGSGAQGAGQIRSKLVRGVNHWISERRENRRLEKAFSDSQISSWKTSG